MKILVTSDLHNHKPWFKWIKSHPQDITIIAGDLLDGLDDCGLPHQVLFTKGWCDSFQGTLALCSGNHDSNTDGLHDDPSAVALLLPDEQKELRTIMFNAFSVRRNNWMDCLTKDRTVTDIRTEVVDVAGQQIVITTLPYLFDDQADPYSAALWEKGRGLRNKLGALWIVLHHEPAYGTSGYGKEYGNKILHERLSDNKPDFLFSGHIHSQPYLGNFADKIGNTWCFNPGHPLDDMLKPIGLPDVPNHIIIDTETKTAFWYANHLLNSKWLHSEKELPL